VDIRVSFIFPDADPAKYNISLGLMGALSGNLIDSVAEIWRTEGKDELLKLMESCRQNLPKLLHDLLHRSFLFLLSPVVDRINLQALYPLYSCTYRHVNMTLLTYIIHVSANYWEGLFFLDITLPSNSILALRMADIFYSVKAAKAIMNRFILDSGESCMKESSNKRHFSVTCRMQSSGCKISPL